MAGICFILSGLEVMYNLIKGSYTSIFVNVIDDLKSGDFRWALINGTTAIGRILAIIALLGLVVVGVLLVTKKHKSASSIMFLSGICRFLSTIFYLLFWVVYPYMDKSTVFNLFTSTYVWSLITAIGWILLGLIKDQRSSLSKLWFLPAILSLVSMVASWIRGGFSFSIGVMFTVFTAMAFLLYGYAIFHGDINMSANPAISVSVHTVQQQQTGNYSGAEELKRYYQLYQEGIITEEEYKTKREEILNR